VSNDHQPCHFVFICQGKDCRQKGAKELLKTFREKVKARKMKKTAKVIKTKCTNNCEHAPVVILGDKWLFKTRKNEVEGLVEKYM